MGKLQDLDEQLHMALEMHEVLNSSRNNELTKLMLPLTRGNICATWNDNPLEYAKCLVDLEALLVRTFSWRDFLILVAFCTLFCVGVVANSFVILCVCLFQHIRNLTNVLLVNLAASDLLVFLICEPWVMAFYAVDGWPFSEFMCKLHVVIQGTCLCVSIFTQASMALERFLVISRPLSSLIPKPRIVTLWVIFIWLLAILLTLPLFYATRLQEKNFLGTTKKYFCIEYWGGLHWPKKAFTLVLFVVLYCFPVVTMTTLYARISRRLLKRPMKEVTNVPTTSITMQSLTQSNISLAQMNCRDAKVKKKESNPLNNVQKTRRHIFQLLLILLSVFTVCWLPYHVVNLFIEFHPNPSHPMINWMADQLYPWTQFIAFSISAINPCCTLFISEKFRHALKSVLHCECCGDERDVKREIYLRNHHTHHHTHHNHNQPTLVKDGKRITTNHTQMEQSTIVLEQIYTTV